MPKNIALIGFMGSGKSTIGRLLAQRLGWHLTDTDYLVEQVAGCSIPQLFEREGEKAFRDRETAILLGVTMGERQVIATGGGAVLREENVAALRGGSLVVYLTARADVLAERVGRRPGQRPMLDHDHDTGESPLTKILRMLAERGPLYQKSCHLVVDSSDRSPQALVEEIIRGYEKRQS
jgi:shikimate kinase